MNGIIFIEIAAIVVLCLIVVVARTNERKLAELEEKIAGKKNTKPSWYKKALIVFPTLFGAAAYVFTSSVMTLVAAVILGLVIPELLLVIGKRRQKAKFEERFLKSLEHLKNSLESGMNIKNAVKSVTECQYIHPAVKKLYQQINIDLEIGLSVSEAFFRLAETADSTDAYDVAVAVSIQEDTGGRTDRVIKAICQNISARIALRREIKSLFAETTSMVSMMSLIAPLAILIFVLPNEEYANIYFSSGIMTFILVLIFAVVFTGTIVEFRMLKKIQKG